MALQVGFFCFNQLLTFSNAGGRNGQDYTPISREVIQFQTGDTVKTFSIGIRQDSICEDDSSEKFYSTLSLENSPFGIILSQSQAAISIDDSMEAECCKQLLSIGYALVY